MVNNVTAAGCHFLCFQKKSLRKVEEFSFEYLSSLEDQ